MSHADEVITDVRTRRVYASAGDGCVTFGWDYPGRTLLEVVILRSSRSWAPQYAATPDAPDQTLVYQGVAGSCRDEGVVNGCDHFYTVFARHPGGEWVRWGEYALRPGKSESKAHAWNRLIQKAHSTFLPRVLMLLVLALGCLAAGLAAPGRAAAVESTEGDQQQMSQSVQAALTYTQTNRTVAAVLGDREATVRFTTWGGTTEDPTGVTFAFRWDAADARDVDAVWPLAKSTSEGTLALSDRPLPPYESVDVRLRITDLTALRADLLLDGPRLLQLMPLDGATEFQLAEQTWAPFSWLPRFTEKPWVLEPLFLLVGVIVALRAWRRSRAWNRRLPSMTRHDRQFVGRLIVIVFLLAGFAWQIYEGVVAATGPTADPTGLGAGDLAALPILLIPPGLFLTALILELSYASHRVAWALLALLSAAASFYSLATAMTGTTTNLNLSYYILLAVLALVSVPRAFSMGKMGWSRSLSPRYG